MLNLLKLNYQQLINTVMTTKCVHLSATSIWPSLKYDKHAWLTRVVSIVASSDVTGSHYLFATTMELCALQPTFQATASSLDGKAHIPTDTIYKHTSVLLSLIC